MGMLRVWRGLNAGVCDICVVGLTPLDEVPSWRWASCTAELSDEGM